MLQQRRNMWRRGSSPARMNAYRITVKGLKGGHSGVDIALGRANSNKLMFRFDAEQNPTFAIRLAEAAGGNLRNATTANPSCSTWWFQLPKQKHLRNLLRAMKKMYRTEFSDTGPDLVFSMQKMRLTGKSFGKKDQYKIIRAVFACPNGVQRMSPGCKRTC